jgi:8-oxo-dGTP pyrophosphatase MutT (NUDIX family)
MWPADAAAARDWIRERLEQGPVDGWRQHLPPRHAFADVREAAVLVPLVWHAGAPTVLLTRRSDQLSAHPGQISFPGGKQDAQDANAVDTALREAQEEIGLEPDRVSVLGTLPRFVTVSRFSVVPVVALIEPPLELILQPGEVAEIFEVPLARVMQAENYLHHVFERDGGQGHYLSLSYRRHFIWGTTAAMLRLISLTLGPR